MYSTMYNTDYIDKPCTLDCKWFCVFAKACLKQIAFICFLHEKQYVLININATDQSH